MERSFETGVPENALEIATTLDWVIFSADERIYIYPASYHPGALGLMKEDLLELVRVIENRNELVQ